MKPISASQPYTMQKNRLRLVSIEIALVIMVIVVLTVSVLRHRSNEAAPREIALYARSVKPSQLVPIPPGGKALMSLRIPDLSEGYDEYVRIECEGEPKKVADWRMKHLKAKGFSYPSMPRWNPSPKKKGKDLLERLALAPSTGQWELGAGWSSSEGIDIRVHGGGGRSIIEYVHRKERGVW